MYKKLVWLIVTLLLLGSLLTWQSYILPRIDFAVASSFRPYEVKKITKKKTKEVSPDISLYLFEVWKAPVNHAIPPSPTRTVYAMPRR